MNGFPQSHFKTETKDNSEIAYSVAQMVEQLACYLKVVGSPECGQWSGFKV